MILNLHYITKTFIKSSPFSGHLRRRRYAAGLTEVPAMAGCCRAEAAGWAGRCWQPGKIGASCGLRIRTASSRMLRGCRSMVHGLAVGVSQACWQLACSKRAGSLESHYCSSVPASSVLAAPHLWILGGVPLLH